MKNSFLFLSIIGATALYAASNHVAAVALIVLGLVVSGAFGVVYILNYIPQIWMCKVGFTKRSIKSRVRGTSKAVFGFTVPVFFCVVPFPKAVEGVFHSLLGGLNKRFYKGDGHTETFIFPGILIALALCFGVWMVEILIILKAWNSFLTA